MMQGLSENIEFQGNTSILAEYWPISLDFPEIAFLTDYSTFVCNYNDLQ